VSGIWDGIDWGRVSDDSLPSGVIAVQDGAGNWWRYPLAEFSDDGEPGASGGIASAGT
jgi:hypothetical protein